MASRLEDAEISSAEVQQAVHDDFLDFTATLIQSSYRGYALRKKYNVLVCWLAKTTVLLILNHGRVQHVYPKLYFK